MQWMVSGICVLVIGSIWWMTWRVNRRVNAWLDREEEAQRRAQWPRE